MHAIRWHTGPNVAPRSSRLCRCCCCCLLLLLLLSRRLRWRHCHGLAGWHLLGLVLLDVLCRVWLIFDASGLVPHHWARAQAAHRRGAGPRHRMTAAGDCCTQFRRKAAVGMGLGMSGLLCGVAVLTEQPKQSCHLWLRPSGGVAAPAAAAAVVAQQTATKRRHDSYGCPATLTVASKLRPAAPSRER